MRIKKGDTGRVVYFVAVDSTDLVARETSLTNIKVHYAIDEADGSATAMTTPTATAVDTTNMAGVFALAIDEAGMVGLGAGVDEAELILHITADEMAPVTLSIEVFREKITAGNTLVVDANGRVDVGKIAGTAQTANDNGADINAILEDTAEIANLNNVSITDINTQCDAAISDAALATAANLAIIQSDGTHTWHVAKTGNDSNGGHSFSDALLTVNEAVSQSSSGDTIKIWPGTYNENITISKSLKLIGSTGTIISQSALGINTIEITSDNTIIENITTIHAGVDPASGESCAIVIDDADNVNISNCRIEATEVGFNVSGTSTDVVIRDCHIIAAEYGVVVNNDAAGYITLIENCFISCSGWQVCYSAGIQTTASSAIVRNCFIKVDMTTTSSSRKVAGVRALSFAAGGAVAAIEVSNSVVQVTSGNTAYERGIWSDGPKSRILASNCIVTTSDADSCYDLSTKDYSIAETDNGTLVSNGNSYDTSKVAGTITENSSGLTDAVNVQCDTAISDAALATAANLQIVDDNVDATLADTNDIQEDWAGVLADFAAILEDTGTTLPAQISGLNNVSAAAVVTAIKAMTGITAGGNYTFAQLCKIISAMLAGKWQDKAGVSGTYQVLDPDNGTTVIMEITPAETTPQKTVSVLI